MFHRSRIALAAASLLATGAALAQEAQRIEITGSSIKRIAAEGALPVITLSKSDIQRTGATSVRDLVQLLPAMQGFTTGSDTVNGQGGGTTTASLRNIGELYTLVLLNGRRVAPFNTGSTVNLEQLPLAAIERVEILADGASAIYGSDAIAGVVNFITSKNTTDGTVDLRVVIPQKEGGKESQASITKGFGDLDRDGFNVLVGASFEKEDKIKASDREFSKSGVIPFTHNGQQYYFWQLSANANPPNVLINDGDLDFYAPTLFLPNGNCGADPASLRQGDTCRFDYTATLEARPEAERKNFFASANFKIGKDVTAFAELLFSDVIMTGRYAPAAQPLPMALNGALFNRYIVPTAAARGFNIADVTSVTYLMRLRDAGLRANDFKTKASHIVLGVEGSVFGWDGQLSYTRSGNKQNDNFAGGFASRNELDRLIANGSFDPFAQGTGSPSAALASAVLTGPVSDTKVDLNTLSIKASRPLFTLPGGSAYGGFGVDILAQRYANNPSPITMGPNALQPNFTDFPVGTGNGSLPFDTRRDSRGVYGEFVAPVLKALELNAAVRYDAYDAAENKRNFVDGIPAASVKQGDDASKTTYKFGLRFNPTPALVLRASVGTGFRAPTLFDIARPLQDFGVISVQRACPVAAGDPLFPGCRPNPTQWKLQTGGNPLTGANGLKPETSDQWSFGVVFEPTNWFTGKVDVWGVKVKDAITAIPEDTAFDNFERYRALFSVTNDSATNRPILTFNQVPVNSAVLESQGVDVDLLLRNNTPIGRLTTQLQTTYLVKSYFDLGFGNGKESSMSRVGADDRVAFRWLVRLRATLDTGAFSNTLSVSWKPGYIDQSYTADDGTVRLRGADGTPGDFVGIEGHKVGSYSQLDWQGKWNFSKALTFTAGIKNLLDEQPPFTIKTVAGNQLGYDPRYADGVGRSFYLQGTFRF
jgi:iron complex outermembrane recepter protein